WIGTSADCRFSDNHTMKAEIIAVGSELLTPDRLDTNSLFLTEELNKIGIEVVRKTVVGDNRDLLSEAFRDASNRVPLIIASGGLGPTEKDLKRGAPPEPFLSEEPADRQNS